MNNECSEQLKSLQLETKRAGGDRGRLVMSNVH